VLVKSETSAGCEGRWKEQASQPQASGTARAVWGGPQSDVGRCAPCRAPRHRALHRASVSSGAVAAPAAHCYARSSGCASERQRAGRWAAGCGRLARLPREPRGEGELCAPRSSPTRALHNLTCFAPSHHTPVFAMLVGPHAAVLLALLIVRTSAEVGTAWPAAGICAGSMQYRCTGLILHPGVCAAEKGADPWALRVSQENLELFQSQVRAAGAHLLCMVLVRLVTFRYVLHVRQRSSQRACGGAMSLTRTCCTT